MSENICQLDGNISISDSLIDDNNHIPVHISSSRQNSKTVSENRIPVLKSVKRNNLILESIKLPVVMNINPRSIYNKTDDFKLLLEQYDADIVCMSESWERENLSLEELLNIDDYKVITNVVQREFRGGKPAILVNDKKFHVKELCPDPVTVPVGVECVWALVTPRQVSSRSQIHHIAVASIYYRGPKSTKKEELFDHITETFHFLKAKYGAKIHFLLCGDTNRLSLTPILNLSPDLKQEVKVYTRLNPPAILDPIITTLGKWYQPPVTMPPVEANPGEGVASDHLIILMSPLVSELQTQPRVYRKIVTRPLNRAGFERFAKWVESCDWSEIFENKSANEMAEIFQNVLVENYTRCFPTKTTRICSEDKPWISLELKQLCRKMKREFCKNKKSAKWIHLKNTFEEKCKKAKEKYYNNIVHDLKTSNPSKWYSKVKRMAGVDEQKSSEILIDELGGLSNKEQAESIALHYTQISNQYDPVDEADFRAFLDANSAEAPPIVEPYQIYHIIRKLNQKAATKENDIPMKLISEFSVELAFPLAQIINCCLKEGTYPDIWKVESVTPVPKIFPPEQIKDLRKISGLLNFSKVMDKVISQFVISDMKESRDVSQYGNEKHISNQHYLIKMLNRILTAIDHKSKSETFAVILNMVDWSQAFDRMSHKIGVESFIANGVRPSLVPILISFFRNRRMKVKWNGELSSEYPLNGGGPQGGLLGILEYLSQTNKNTEFLSNEDKFKFIDDLSFLEIINLLIQGLKAYNVKSHVPSDININNQYLPSQDLSSQQSLEMISKWTEDNQMKLNSEKTNYMIFNTTRKHQFSTRLMLSGNPLQQVSEKKLLGVVINDKLNWDANTKSITCKAFKRMVILHRLYSFGLPTEELVNIYVLYIRSVVENCAVVWHSSLTVENETCLERVQKAALRIILRDQYENYEHALKVSGLETLAQRRTRLCLKFARKCVKNPATEDIFPLNNNIVKTRVSEKFYVQPARTDRLKFSAVPYMQRLLNSQNKP